MLVTILDVREDVSSSSDTFLSHYEEFELHVHSVDP